LSTTLTLHTMRATIARIAAVKLIERCSLLAQITEVPGQLLRTFLSPSMDEVHRQIRPWMEAAGMVVSTDRAGNLRGVYASAFGESAPRLLIASHLDTVPDAGAYDGILGVLAGLALVEASTGSMLPFTIEVVGFSDEEGTRFGVPFLGSRALINDLSGDLLRTVDSTGVSLAEALEGFVVSHPDAASTGFAPETVGYLEFHIEQGPVLESKKSPLGIVESIAGQSRYRLCFRGQAGHAGTTPMPLRRDALMAAAEWMVRVEAIAGRFDEVVATVGQISAEPGAVNVIPGCVHTSLDVRHADDAVRETAVEAILNEATAIAAKRRVSVEFTQYHSQAAVQLNRKMIEMAAKAAQRAGYSAPRMISGAGHDAMIIAPHLPTAMIFLRSPGGISHHPDECVIESDVAAAIHAGLCFLDEFALFLQEKGSSLSA
jgi:allantoate deiminase